MSDCRFAKHRRLRKPSAFHSVYQDNQVRVKGQYFVVLAFSRFCRFANKATGDTMSDNLPLARLGVVVSKKVSKLAVRRNRIKRLMREVFRCRSHPLGFDFVVIAKPAANMVDNVRLQKELHFLWKKLHQRCADY